MSILVTLNVYGLIGLAATAWFHHRQVSGRLSPATARETVTLTFEDSLDPAPPALMTPVQGGAPSPEAPEGTDTIDPRLLNESPILPMDAAPKEVQDIPTTLPLQPRTIGDARLPVAPGGTGLSHGEGRGNGHGSAIGSGRAMIRGVPGMNAGLDLSELEVLHEEIPHYPLLAEWGHIQGDVVVRVTINEHGVPIRTELLEGPPALQAETLRAVKLWRFGKGIFRGRKVNATFDMTFRYILRTK